MKYLRINLIIARGQVALLRGGAWIEIKKWTLDGVAMLVALLRGGAWIEINLLSDIDERESSRTPSRGCVD